MGQIETNGKVVDLNSTISIIIFNGKVNVTTSIITFNGNVNVTTSIITLNVITQIKGDHQIASCVSQLYDAYDKHTLNRRTQIR